MQTYLSGPPRTAEDVVRRIAGECALVGERGGGIRLEPGGPQPSFIALLVSG